mgnify:CR=1 FL=1
MVALARKSWTAKDGALTAASLQGLTFAGLMALQDPLRPREIDARIPEARPLLERLLLEAVEMRRGEAR